MTLAAMGGTSLSTIPQSFYSGVLQSGAKERSTSIRNELKSAISAELVPKISIRNAGEDQQVRLPRSTGVNLLAGIPFSLSWFLA